MVVVRGATSAPAEKPTGNAPLRVTLAGAPLAIAATWKMTDFVQSAIAAYCNAAMAGAGAAGSRVTETLTAPGAASATVYTGATRATLERTTSTSLPCTGRPTGPAVAPVTAASRFGVQLDAAPATGAAGKAIAAPLPVPFASKPAIPCPKLVLMSLTLAGGSVLLAALIAEWQARLPALRTDCPIRLSAKRPLSAMSPTPAVASYALREPMKTEMTAPVSNSASTMATISSTMEKPRCGLTELSPGRLRP